jgi:hypothetical protein
MTANPSDEAARLTRRSLLQAAAGAAAILGVTADPAAAQIKVSKASVAYQDEPDGNQDCGMCAHFAPPSACQIVQGPISPRGYCRLFTPAQQRG